MRRFYWQWDEEEGAFKALAHNDQESVTIWYWPSWRTLRIRDRTMAGKGGWLRVEKLLHQLGYRAAV